MAGTHRLHLWILGQTVTEIQCVQWWWKKTNITWRLQDSYLFFEDWVWRTFNNDRGKCRQLSLWVHSRDAILCRILKITPEIEENHVDKVHHTHFITPKGSGVLCPTPTSAWPPISYVNDTTWVLWSVSNLLTRNTLTINRHRWWCHWKPAGFGLFKVSVVCLKMWCLTLFYGDYGSCG